MRKNQSSGASASARSARTSLRLEADAVLQILRDEDLAAQAKAFGVTTAALKRYRSKLLRGGLSALLGARAAVGMDEDLEHLRAKIRELTQEIERRQPSSSPVREPAAPWVPRMSRA